MPEVSRENIQNLHRNRGRMSASDMEMAAARLVGAHDEIITHEELAEHLAKDEDGKHVVEKAERRATYAQLNAESAKYPGMVPHHDPLFGAPYLSLRAKMEAFRGVQRDATGKIKLTPAQRTERIASCRAKIAEMLGPDADLSQTYGPKIEGLKSEIAYQQEFLDGKRELQGDILDVLEKFGKDGE